MFFSPKFIPPTRMPLIPFSLFHSSPSFSHIYNLCISPPHLGPVWLSSNCFSSNEDRDENENVSKWKVSRFQWWMLVEQKLPHSCLGVLFRSLLKQGTLTFKRGGSISTADPLAAKTPIPKVQTHSQLWLKISNRRYLWTVIIYVYTKLSLLELQLIHTLSTTLLTTLYKHPYLVELVINTLEWVEISFNE